MTSNTAQIEERINKISAETSEKLVELQQKEQEGRELAARTDEAQQKLAQKQYEQSNVVLRLSYKYTLALP